MSIELWADVDRFFEKSMLCDDLILNEILIRSDRAGLPAHNVSPCQEQLLQILTMMTQAKRVLEIGTLGGYSTIWFARAIPDDGQVVTIEFDERHALTALENFKLAGVSDRVTLIRDDAGAVLNNLYNESAMPFDLIFIDADKHRNPEYLEASLRLSRPGTVIIGDNVVREGAVADAQSTDAKVLGIRQYCKNLRSRGMLSTGIQTVGVKGYDGFAISIVQ